MSSSDLKSYTKVSVEIKHSDNDDISRYEILKNRWDLSMEELFELFRDVSLAAGFHPNTVSQWFNDE